MIEGIPLWRAAPAR